MGQPRRNGTLARDLRLWLVVVAGVALSVLHGFLGDFIAGPVSDVAKLIDILFIPFYIIWALLLARLTTQSTVSVDRARIYGGVLGGLDGLLVGLGVRGRDASVLLGVGIGLVSAVLSYLTFSGWLIWWHHNRGKEKLSTARRMEPSNFFKLLAIVVVVGFLLGIALLKWFPGPAPTP